MILINEGAVAPTQDLAACLRLPQVINLTGLSKPTIYRLAKAGLFPQPLKIGARAVVWLRVEVVAFIELRARMRT